MIKLSREIRFALTPPGQLNQRDGANSWAGWPATHLVVPQLVLRCVVAGQPDVRTGYLVNIKRIDDMLREIVVERLIPKYWEDMANTGTGGGSAKPLSTVLSAEMMLRFVREEVTTSWHSFADVGCEIVSISLLPSPFLEYSISNGDPQVIQLTEQFEFSAAHRLHCPEMSDAENRELFGKCNNPAGHGHNYVVEIAVRRAAKNEAISLASFETTVKRLVIDRLDHKHLNEDIEYFSNLNPSVENISIAIFNWLDGQLGDLILKKVRVYETPKTWAEFAGRNA